MFIFPIGHEQDTVRRLPIVSFAIIAICILVHLFVSAANHRVKENLTETISGFVNYYMLHPYLEINASLKETLGIDKRAETEMEALLGMAPGGVPDDDIRALEQARFDALGKKVLRMIDRIPVRRWGLIPTHKKVETLFTHMFLHAGWIHLLTNLFLFYLCGPLIEDAWGRPFFIAFYLAAGVFSALAYTAIYPRFSGSLIGASGAIAGVMGAFLIRYWKTRIRFAYLFFYIYIARGTFLAPAWLILPIWFFIELFSAGSMDAMKSYGGGGVAHWVHVIGFLFGIAVALMVRMLRIEERRLAPLELREERKEENRLNVILEAGNLMASGNAGEAYRKLQAAMAQNSSSAELVDSLWKASAALGKQADVAPPMIRLIERELRNGQYDRALAHIDLARDHLSPSSLSSNARILLVEALLAKDRFTEARAFYRHLLSEASPRTPSGLLLELCRRAIQWDKQLNLKLAPGVVQLCLENPEIPPEKKEELVRLLPGN